MRGSDRQAVVADSIAGNTSIPCLVSYGFWRWGPDDCHWSNVGAGAMLSHTRTPWCEIFGLSCSCLSLDPPSDSG